MKIIKNYLSYYENPSIKNATELFNEITNYDFENYENFINEFNIKPKANSYSSVKKLFSNTKNYYFFGPNFDFWRENIDSWKTCSEGSSPKIFVKDKFPWKSNIETFKDIKKYDYSNFIILDFAEHHKKSFDFMINTINKVYETSGPVDIFSMPLRFLFLFSFEEIIEFLIKSEKINSIISMDCEPFYKKKKLQKTIHINNQMMDWKSGVCFRTCRYGQIHFLPTFKIEKNKVINLINLCEYKYNNLNDHIYIEKERRLCECKKYYIPITFVPHKKNQPIIKNQFLYDLELVENLRSNFLNLQFLQNSMKINVLYDCVGNIKDDDVETIKNFIKKNHYNIDIDFIKKFHRIGSKIPTYFRHQKKFL
jgi:hypothetical protein